MDINKLEVWQLFQDLPDDLYFYGLEDTSDTVMVFLKQLGVESKVLKITFDGVLSYRVGKESARSKTFYDNKSLRGFMVATDSTYLKWFEEESRGIYHGSNLHHYYISNIDNVIDIIAGPPVKVEWIDGSIS